MGAIGTNIAVGRANIEKAYSEAVGARGGGLQITFTRHATRLLSPTTAIVHGPYEVTSATPPGKERANDVQYDTRGDEQKRPEMN